MLYDKEFQNKWEADQYVKLIEAEYGYVTVLYQEPNIGLWIVEVWKV